MSEKKGVEPQFLRRLASTPFIRNMRKESQYRAVTFSKLPVGSNLEITADE
jgi:hypothetical protein